MTDERWLDRQLAEKAGNDLVRAPLPLFLGARPRYPALEVGAPGRSGNARGRSDPSAVTPGAGDRELAAMPEPRELRREIALAHGQTRAAAHPGPGTRCPKRAGRQGTRPNIAWMTRW